MTTFVHLRVQHRLPPSTDRSYRCGLSDISKTSVKIHYLTNFDPNNTSNVEPSCSCVVFLNDFDSRQETSDPDVVVSVLLIHLKAKQYGYDQRTAPNGSVNKNGYQIQIRSYQQDVNEQLDLRGSSSQQESIHHFMNSQCEHQTQFSSTRTFGSKNSPGSSTSAVCKLKLLKKRHFSSIKKDLRME